MKNYSKIKNILRNITAVLVLGCFAILFFVVYRHTGARPTSEIISSVTLFFSLLSVLIYCLFGFKKDGAFYYKCFIDMFIVFLIADIVCFAGSPLNTIGILICSVLMFVCLFILGFANNLGKLKSYLLGGLALSSNIAFLIQIIIQEQYLDGVLFMVCRLILTIILLLMITAKYIDKAERKSK